MKNLLSVLIFVVLCFPFRTFAADPFLEVLKKMHDCISKEFNKCGALESECNIPCIGGGKCSEDCYLKRNECLDYSRRVEDKYDECVGKKEAVIFGNDRFAKEQDRYCKASIIFSDCMDNFNGLCKFSWPLNCNSQSGKRVDTYNENDNSGDIDDTNNNLDYSLIGLPLDSSINAVPCIGTAPENSEPCPGDEEEIYYYSERKLADVCSIPEGSEPKCEYVCKNEYDFVAGECRSAGIFARIVNWFGRLF